MSPISREREYARRRYEKWQSKQAEKRARQLRQRRRVLIAGAAVAVALIAGGTVAWLNGSDGDNPSTAIASPSGSASTSPGSSARPSPSASGSSTGSAAASPASSAGPNPCPSPTGTQPPQQTFSKAPDPALAQGKKWTMTFKTSCGDIVATLDGAKAPKAVANAIFLSGKKFWDGLSCHRLGSPGFPILQCGDPSGLGSGGPGYQFGPVENAPSNNVYTKGMLAMARTTDPNSMGSQFFFVYGNVTIPGGYTVFGTVTQGIDIVEKIGAGGVGRPGPDGSGPPARAISIVSTSVTPA